MRILDTSSSFLFLNKTKNAFIIPNSQSLEMSLIIPTFERLIIDKLYIPEKTTEARKVYDSVNRHHLALVWDLKPYYSENEVTEYLLDTN